MRALLRALPVVVAALAATDTLLVRGELAHRPVEARLFCEAAALWLAFSILALLPARATLGLLERWRRGSADGDPRRGARPALVLAGWTAYPVVAHGALDAFTRAGEGLSALGRPLPWLVLAGVTALFLLLLGAAERGMRRVPGRPLALGVAAAALAAGLLMPLRSAGVREDRGQAGADGRPNLLLVVWDTCRADRLEAYGYDRATAPGLARLSEESIVFENARSVSCFTFTSHLSMLTGVMPSVHGARLLSMRFDPRRATTIAETLGLAGYRTGAFVGTDVLGGRTGIRHGFEVYDDRVDPRVCDTRAWRLVHDLQSLLALASPAFRANGRPHWIQDFQRPADRVLERALAWIRADDPRPWFCLVNLYDAHWPYLPGDEARGRFVGGYGGPMDGYLFRSDAWVAGYQPDEADRRHVSDLYVAEIHGLDRRFGAFLGELDLGRGGTAVLVTSDHGEAFGEAGTWKHEHVFEPQLRVPLLVRLPQAEPEGRRVAAPVSGIDVAPTLLGLAGLAPPPGFQGLDLLAAPPDPERPIRVEDRDHLDPADVRLVLYRGPWKVVRRGLGDRAVATLHDLRSDPVGEVDLGGRHPELLARLLAELEALWGGTEAIEALGPASLGSQEDALRALGYLGEGR